MSSFHQAKLYKVAPFLFFGFFLLFFGFLMAPPAAHAADVTPPSKPGNLVATSGGTSQINLTWSASTDNVGVKGYDINRDGAHWAISAGTSYFDLGITPGTSHTYTVDAYDAAGNISTVSNAVSAMTGSIGDLTPPVARLTSPVPNSKVSSTASIVITATDNVGVTNVELYVDGMLSQTDTSGESPLTFLIDTTTLKNGNHTVFVRAYDAGSNVGTSGFITIIVANTILPTLNATLTASTLSGNAPITISLNAQVSGTATGTVNYYFYCNRADAGTDVTTPYDLNVAVVTSTSYAAQDVCTYPAQGTYTIKVLAERGNALPAQAQKTMTVKPFPVTSSTFPLGFFKITSVTVSNITDKTAMVTINTNQSSSIQMKYGTDTTYGQQTSQSPELTTIHENLSGLTASTTYDFAITATPYGSAYPAYSPNYVFNTAATGTIAVSSTVASGSGSGSSVGTGAGAPATSLSRNLKVGDSGSDVRLLQVALQQLGYLPTTLIPTNYFGALTQHALLLFQNDHLLNRSGYLDDPSLTLLNKTLANGQAGAAASSRSPAPTPATPPAPATSFTRSLGIGSQGSDVVLLQQVLKKDGDYTGPITGLYGPLTAAGVQAFQIKAGIATFGTPQTTGFGAVGGKTLPALNGIL